jgi:hypothetical protein
LLSQRRGTTKRVEKSRCLQTHKRPASRQQRLKNGKRYQYKQCGMKIGVTAACPCRNGEHVHFQCGEQEMKRAPSVDSRRNAMPLGRQLGECPPPGGHRFIRWSIAVNSLKVALRDIAPANRPEDE